MRLLINICLFMLTINVGRAVEVQPIFKPLPALIAAEVAVVVNDADPLSVSIAKYYQQQRHIPAAQMVHLRFASKQPVLAQAAFEQLKKQVDKALPDKVQALVLTWSLPYRVDCMSITTAFALGFDPAFCADSCAQTRRSPYYASNSSKPFTDLKLRPTMMLAGETLEDVKRLIDRGIKADYARPQGSAYLLKTSDVNRSTRAHFFPAIAQRYVGIWPVNYVEADSITDKKDVMFYFTGLEHVPDLETNQFLPGAVADHLTSTGGVLSGGDQMSVLEWLKAGATGSFGAVIEPCNFTVKFPDPDVLLHFYLRGNTLIEAYWKSVLEPGQGIFVGEPLAKPFAYAVAMTKVK